MPVPLWNHNAISLPPAETTGLVCESSLSVGSACHLYDSKMDRWTRGPRLNVARTAFGLVNYHGQIYALGGMTNPKDEDTVEVLTSGGVGGMQWKMLPNRLFTGGEAKLAVALL